MDTLMCTDVGLMRSLLASHDFLYGDGWIPSDGLRGSRIPEKETKLNKIICFLTLITKINSLHQCYQLRNTCKTSLGDDISVFYVL